MNDNPAVIIDNGSGMMKAGTAGEDTPKAYFPSVVGIPRFEKVHGADEKDFYVGNDTIKKRGVLTMESPIENGMIRDWENMRKIWHHCYYNELKIDPSDQPVLLTEAPLNSQQNREDMLEIFFETFKVPAFYVFTQAVLSLYASGKTTGVVFDSGDGVTHIATVYDGYCIQHAVSRVDLAGKDITNYLQKNLKDKGHNFKSAEEKEIAKSLKEKLCRVAYEYDDEVQLYKESKTKLNDFELPDGNKVNIGHLAIKAPECLFKPSLMGLEIAGIHKSINKVIQDADSDLKRELYENIVLCGGNTDFPGFADRVHKEMSELAPDSINVKILAPMDRKFSAWIGGSVLSTLDSFNSSWITKTEYYETGPSIIQRKCF